MKQSDKIIENAKAETESMKLKLESEINEAKALLNNPELLKLKQIEMLTKMAESGAKFVIGLSNKDINKIIDV